MTKKVCKQVFFYVMTKDQIELRMKTLNIFEAH